MELYVPSHRFEIQIMSHSLKRQGLHCSSIPRVPCSQYAVAHQRQRVHRAILAVCGVNREALLASPCVSWDPLTLCTVYLCFWYVPTDHNPAFFAFSSCLHFPKNIYEGNFGCGYLKERRASGLVFCENTTSVYRALFVSPLAPSSVFSEDCPSVAWKFVQSAHWNDAHAIFIFLHDFSYLVFILCWFCQM